MEHFTTSIALIGIVIIVASLLSGAIERIGVPLVAAFLALGVLLGPMGLGLANVELHSPILEVLATLALGLVLFSDAVTLDTKQIRARKRLVWRLIGPGTLIPAILIALAGWWLLDISAPAAAILGAALASTDPVLLRTLLRSRTLPGVPRMALRLETGMNDVILLPIVILAMLLLRNGGAPAGEVRRNVIGLFLLGPALGALVGWLGISALIAIRTRIGVRRDYESLYAIGLAFSAYAAADLVGGSGFLAAFAAGFLVAAQDVELCDCFLEYGEASAEMLLLLTFVAFGNSLIWTGLSIISWRTLLFAVIALVARTVVLLPVLARAGIDTRDRRLIALFGPRGLSSLLLVLLPVFAGLPGAAELFTVTCLVVLLSVLVHGTGIALFLGAHAPARHAAPSPPKIVELPWVAEANGASETTPGEPASETSDRITVGDVKDLWARGEPVIVVDARADRSYQADDLQAKDAVRLPPDDPVRAAGALRLAHHATLVVYCA